MMHVFLVVFMLLLVFGNHTTDQLCDDLLVCLICNLQTLKPVMMGENMFELFQPLNSPVAICRLPVLRDKDFGEADGAKPGFGITLKTPAV